MCATRASCAMREARGARGVPGAGAVQLARGAFPASLRAAFVACCASAVHAPRVFARVVNCARDCAGAP
eukprot:11161295-Lingulodinium_polyedra.AAC.1